MANLVLLAALTLAGGKAEAQDSSNPAGWLTFTEPDFGFQIAYPAHWVVRLVADNTQTIDRYGEEVALRSIGFFGPDSQIVFVDVWQNQGDLTVEEWLSRYPPPMAADPTLVKIASVAAVAGEPAVRLAGIPVAGGAGIPWHYRTQFRRGKQVMSIEYAALEPDLAVYETMLTSFNPIPLNPTPNKSNTHRNTLSTALPPAEFGITEATCCGLTDPEYNPFPCNTAGDASCPFPPCGNCTWWVRYRRAGDAVANLTHCTNDAHTWDECAAQYYPGLVSIYAQNNAVVLYPGQNHLSFVEETHSGGSYSASDLSWDSSCPAHYFNASYGGGKQYILHPDYNEPNEPPNAPLLDTPDDDQWLTSPDVKLTWKDGGDPDDGPQPYRDFMAEIWRDGGDWSAHSSWDNDLDWQITLPEDGRYAWRVKAHDGLQESIWPAKRYFQVDSAVPAIRITASPQLGRWYNTEQSLSWTVSDPDPGSGVDYFKWAWDDDTPDSKVSAAQGTTFLSSAGQGQHSLYLRAWDEAGNASGVTGWGWIGYDTLGPGFIFSADNLLPERWYNTPQPISWTLDDPLPGVGGAYTRWSWDNTLLRAYMRGGGGQTRLAYLQGKRTLYLRGWDQLGNAGSLATQGWFGYDSLLPEPPQITVNCSAANNQPQNACQTPSFTWAGTDSDAPNASGVLDYTFAWGITSTTRITPPVFTAATGYTPTLNLPPDGAVKYYLHVQARDGAGNVSSPATYAFWYDTLAGGGSALLFSVFEVKFKGGALYSNVPTVTVTAGAPNVTGVHLGVSEADIGGAWRASPLTTTWVVSDSDDYFTPRRVYAWFKDADEIIYGPYFDDIIYDPVPPKGRVTLVGAKTTTVTLALLAWDDNSGLADMRIGSLESVTQATWLPYTHTSVYSTTTPIIYAQFRDRAGNPSPVYGSDGSDSSMTERVYFPLIFR